MGVVEASVVDFSAANYQAFRQGNGRSYTTVDFPACPFGLYLFCWSWHRSGVSPQSLPPSGMGLTWTLLRSHSGSSTLLEHVVGIASAVGTPRRGPLSIPSLQLGDEPDPPLQVSYHLLRIRNAPLGDNGMEALVQTNGLSGPSGATVPDTPIVPNKLSDQRNLVVAMMGGDDTGASIFWPFVSLTQVGFYQGDDGGNGTWAGRTNKATVRWGPVAHAGAAVEIGYHAVPWLRQRQRDDI